MLIKERILQAKTDIFIEEAKYLYGSRYDYSKAQYTSSNQKLIITCPQHGDFLQSRSNHLQGKEGCKRCYYNKRKINNKGKTYKKKPLEQRFWKHVDKSPHPKGCWLWIGYKTKEGYGQFEDGMATHVSWSIHNGLIPEGLWVLHTCDNPPCVNPSHLWLGTHQDNMDDMISKNRASWQKRKYISIS